MSRSISESSSVAPSKDSPLDTFAGNSTSGTQGGEPRFERHASATPSPSARPVADPARRAPGEHSESDLASNGQDEHDETARSPGNEDKKPPSKETSTPADADNPEPKKNKTPWYKRPLLVMGLLVLLIVATVVGVLWWLYARQFESTDDAFIEGHVITISSQATGYVDVLAVTDNQVVHQGELLVQIDPRDTQAKLAQAQAQLQSSQSKVAQALSQIEVLKANVAQAEANVVSAEADAAYSQRDLQRFQNAGSAASQQELDTATASERSKTAALDAARAAVVAAKAQVANGQSAIATAQADVEQQRTLVRQAEINLEYTHVLAPQDGRITRRTVEQGDYVQPGQSLLAIVPHDVWVVANFKETQLDHMRPGQPVTVHIDAYSSRDFSARVDSVQKGTGARFSLLPPENATGNYVKVVQRVPVKIIFDQPLPSDLVLAPGMSVEPRVKVR